MNRLTKKLVLSILTVVLTVVALGTTTFAWFTLGNTVTIKEFDAQIILEDGIEVSLNGTDWYSVLTPDLIEAQLATNSFDKFNHVTSEDGMVFKSIEDDNSGLDTADTTTYIALKLYFRSAQEKDILWTDVNITGGTRTFNADVSFIHSDNELYGPNEVNKIFTVNAQDAIRISVVEVGGSTPVVYENAASATNTILGAKDGNGVTLGLQNGAADYYRVKRNELPFGFKDVTTFKTVGTIQDLDTGQSIMRLAQSGGAGYFLGELMIYIWLEGYDQEAYNSILGLGVSIDFEFKGA